MEGDIFDAFVRGLGGGASRRGLVGAGIGALAAAALATLGLGEDATGKKKQKKKKKKKKPSEAQRCTGNRPVTCGAGCCPSIFSNCCQDTDNPVIQTYCAPNSEVCCPITGGFAGYSCPAEAPKCCPPTLAERFGECTDVGGTCCTNAQGGETCPAAFPVCCPDTPGDPFDGSYCCAEGETCCVNNGDCPSNMCLSGCCVSLAQAARDATGAREAQGAGHGRSGRASHRRVRPTRLLPAT